MNTFCIGTYSMKYEYIISYNLLYEVGTLIEF